MAVLGELFFEGWFSLATESELESQKGLRPSENWSHSKNWNHSKAAKSSMGSESEELKCFYLFYLSMSYAEMENTGNFCLQSQQCSLH